MKTVTRLQMSVNARGDVEKGATKLTIKEIADVVGVSVTTVSQILNNKGSRFSEKTRNKALAAVAENHYKPDYFTLNVINRHSKAIGMIVSDVTDLSFSKVIEGVETYLNSLGYMILLCNSKHDLEQAMQYVSELIHRSVDDIIFVTPNILLENHILKDRRKHPISVILTDRGINPQDGGRLIVKEYKGAYRTVHHLVQQGHQHIDMLRESAGYYRLTERVTAYQHALQDNNLLFRPHYICVGGLSLHGGYVAAKEVLKNEEITAIFCGNDEIAMGAHQAVGEAGKKIPDDISVVGSDGLEISEYLVPSLATVYQSSFDIGYYAAEFLMEAIADPTGKVPNKVFDVTFIAKKSTKPI